MKKVVSYAFVFVIAFALGYLFKSEFETKSIQKKPISQKEAVKPAIVKGIGGIFFKATNPAELKAWYKKHLGLDTDAYGFRFEWQEGADSTRQESLQWSPFSASTTYFAPSKKDFMINYRVENLAQLVEKLKKEEVNFLDSIATYPYGKFIHIMDSDGNKLELFEPDYTYK
jgi:predicted enzyme related to lactoylglutathione lyase